MTGCQPFPDASTSPFALPTTAGAVTGELPDAADSPAGGAADEAPERQLTLLVGGGRQPEWWLSTRTRVVGKRGVADARAVLSRSSRGQLAVADAEPERRAG